MDHSGKKHVSGIDFGRARSGIRFREPSREIASMRGCSRLGCGSRLDSTNGVSNNNEKSKGSRPAFRTSIASTFSNSSKTACPVRKSKDKRIMSSAAESSCQKDPIEQPNSIGRNMDIDKFDSLDISVNSHPRDSAPEKIDSGSFSRFPLDSAGEPYSNDLRLRQESRNLSIRRIRPVSQRVSLDSSVHRPNGSQNGNQSFRTQQRPNINFQRHGSRNTSSRLATNVLESGSSSSASPSNRRADASRRKCPNAESAQYKFTGISSSSRDTSTSPTTTNIPSSTILRPSAQPSSQRIRRPTSRYVALPTTTLDVPHRRESRRRFIEDDMFSLPEPIFIAQEPQSESPDGDSTSLLSFTEAPPLQPGYNRSSGRGSSRNRRSSHDVHDGDGSSQIDIDPLIYESGQRHFNMNGIAEVLLALDRIEQDEELSYQQLLILETNLLLGSLGIYDQHRDLRLDIDNMSYEELLALGESMGTVNTALSEEDMSKCVKRFTFKSTSTSLGAVASVNDAKCSICQEEYLAGDEVCRLVCEHLYHTGCIRQWFQLKNWCPICKSAALPSSS